MRRREFITLIGGAAAVWPLAARAQPASPVPRIGVLWHTGSAEEEGPYFRSLVNVTGSTYASDVVGRRLQILKEIIPGLSRVAQLVNPNSPASRLHIELTQAAATELGVTVQRFEARALGDLEPTLDAMANAGMQAILVNPEGLPFQGRAIEFLINNATAKALGFEVPPMLLARADEVIE
jgi:ABC transporter substrate binding protein